MLRHVSTVLSRSIVAQGIAFLSLPLLARLFPPAAFGVYQFYQSVTAVLLISASFRYDFALLQADEGEECDALAKLALLLALGTAVVAGLGLTLLVDAGYLHGSQVPAFGGALLAIGLFAAAAGQLLAAFLVRRQQYGPNANSRIVQSVGYGVAGAGLGAVAPVPTGLIYADIVGRLLAIGWMVRVIGARELRRVAAASGSAMRRAGQRFRRYPLYSMPGGLMNMAASVAPPMYIFLFVDAGTAGQFSLVDRAIGLPVGLVIAAVSQVFMAQLAQDLRSGRSEALRSFWRIILVMSALSAAPVAIAIVAGPQLFELVFGPAWVEAGHYARLLAPMYGISLIVGPLNTTLLLLELQGRQMAWEAARLIAVALGLWSVHLAGTGAGGALLVHAGVNIVANIIFLLIAGAAVRARTRVQDQDRVRDSGDH